MVGGLVDSNWVDSNWFVICLIDWLVGRLIVIGLLFGWLIGCLIVWLVGLLLVCRTAG